MLYNENIDGKDLLFVEYYDEHFRDAETVKVAPYKCVVMKGYTLKKG